MGEWLVFSWDGIFKQHQWVITGSFEFEKETSDAKTVETLEDWPFLE